MKGEPEFYGERVVQPYRNPTDKRIRKLIHEEGKMGTNLYNWWNVNLCKNVSKDKKEYSNQIPESLLSASSSATTNFGDLVADPFWNILNQQNRHAPWTSCGDATLIRR